MENGNSGLLGGTDDDAVILVDANDASLGTAPKLEAHRRGLKHRAVSALVRNSEGLLLLQQRAAGKYHSAGQWTNACCSHPRLGESTLAAVHRRLAEEMGVHCALEPLFKASYRSAVSNELVEDEIVHVFGGIHDGPVAPDPAEVSAWKWLSLPDIIAEQRRQPDAYTVWFLHYVRNYGEQIADWLR
ncbi:MAG: isopentenyl-diphosphate Delta-isomerase [Alphaproteobacteria bacterium]|jgi:isopentenyl-diphosphate delta-isomerase|nr:isopentenyl-diphosphate Delta-isomerase [Alphaproteobacteria bacterium]